MSHARLPRLLAALALLAPVGTAAAQVERTFGFTISGMPHPATAAIVHQETLGLTRQQVQALERTSERIERAVMALMEVGLDTTKFLRHWRMEPLPDSIALLREGRAALEAEVHVTLEMARARDEAFRILTPRQRTMLDSIVLQPFRLGPGDHRHPCVAGGSGGVGGLTPRVQLAYDVSYEGDSAAITAITVARMNGSGTRASPPMDGRWESSLHDLTVPGGGGGTIGSWFLRHDTRQNVVWVNRTAIPMDGNNVLLLDNAQRTTELPDIFGKVSVPSRFHTGGCRDRDFFDALRAHLLASPEIRAFVEARP